MIEFLLLFPLGLYVLLILIIAFAIKSSPPSTSGISKTYSIILPFGTIKEFKSNEVHALNNDHKTNLILVNDTGNPIISADIQQIPNTHHSGKKGALTTGIEQSNAELIVTTDADCRPHKNWPESLLVDMGTNDIRLGPVILQRQSGFLNALERIEFHTLQGITAGTANLGYPVLANGANLAFPKAYFTKVKGYSDHMDLDTGDDTFLVLDANKHGLSVSYIASEQASVTTSGTKSIRDYFKQRSRWISKVPRYTNAFALFLSYLTTIANALMLVYMTLLFGQTPLLFGIAIFAKIVVDYLVLIRISNVLKVHTPHLYILPIGLIYPFILLTTVTLGLTRKPKGQE